MHSMDIDSPATPSMAITPVPAEDNGITPVSTEQPNKRRKKSIVWDHFTIETVGPDCTRASCNYCKKSFAYITGSKLAGTSHLKRHIDLGICPVSRRKNEASQHISGVKSEPPPKRRYRTSPALCRSIPFDQDRCNLDVAKMIVQHDYPLHIVEHPGFVDFVRSLQPNYSMVSFNTIQGEIVGLYLREKQGLLDLISGLPGRVSFSLDLKTSNLDVGYGFLTGHFIDNDWNLHHRILNVVMLPFPESEYAFSQAVVSCISDWHLESRLFTLTLDQSVSNENIIGNLRGLLSVKNQFMFNGQLVKGNCYARVLSRLAQDALAATDEVVKRIRESVKYVKTSDSHDEKFAELRQRLLVPNTRELIIDDKTRWDTTYHMLVAACELKEVFSCLDTTDPIYKINPSMDDWKQVEILCIYLKLLYDAASILTGPMYPPANLFYHEVSKIQLELTHAAASEDPFVSNLARPLKERFDQYWRDCFLVLAIAIVMDPRFKMKLVEFSFSRIFGEDAGMWIKIVDDGIHELFLDYVAPNLSVPTAFMDVGNTSISHSDIFQEENHHVDISAQELDSQPNGELVKDLSNMVMNHYEVAQEISTQEAPLKDMHTQEPMLVASQKVTKQMGCQSVEAKEVNGHVEATQEMESQEGRQEMNGQAEPPEMGSREVPMKEMGSREAKMEEIHNTEEVPMQENHIEVSIKENNKEEVSPIEMLTEERIPCEVVQAQGTMEKMEAQEKVTQEIQDHDKRPEDEENITVERHAQEEQKPDMDAQEKQTQEVDSPSIPTEDMHASGKSTNEMHNQEVISEHICAQEAPAHASSDQTPKDHAEEKPAEEQTESLKPADEQTESLNSAEEKTTEKHSSEVQTEEMRSVEAQMVEIIPSDGPTQETETEGQTQEMHSQSQEMQLQSRPMQHQGENGEMQTRHLHSQDLHFQGVQYYDQDQQAMYNQEMHSQEMEYQALSHEMHTQDFPQLSVGDGLLDFEVYISETSNSLHLKSELDQYLEESLLPRVQDFDVLGWWRLNKLKYPTLSKMAADILSIPISTVAPESVFDIGSRKIDSYRSSLQPVTLEALVCAKDWLQFGSSDSSLDMSNALMKMEH